jgi:hypothetical protein
MHSMHNLAAWDDAGQDLLVHVLQYPREALDALLVAWWHRLPGCYIVGGPPLSEMQA